MTEHVYYNALDDEILLVHKKRGVLWCTPPSTKVERDGEVVEMTNGLGLFVHKIKMKNWNQALKEGWLVELGRLCKQEQFAPPPDST